jgi:hypothetical protein
MRRTTYFKRASRRFLEGTKFKTPCEAVEAGACNLEAWTRILAEERDLEAQYLHTRAEHKRSGRLIRAVNALQA